MEIEMVNIFSHTSCCKNKFYYLPWLLTASCIIIGRVGSSDHFDFMGLWVFLKENESMDGIMMDDAWSLSATYGPLNFIGRKYMPVDYDQGEYMRKST